MSHWVKAKVKITEKRYLLSALTSLDLDYVDAKKKISFSGSSATVDISLGEAMGMKQEKDGTWELLGDPYYCSGKIRSYYRKEKELAQDISTRYSVEKTTAELSNMGFNFTENGEGLVGQDGLIQMVATRWV